ncbi:MAG TPA: phosphoribosylamine--glycine ligase [Myxococcota bacterium]|nr:phosphoribosylamine--glycine ligase [Myxococcota bacterium]
MRVLLVGSGGREHALAWKLARSPQLDALLAAPGSDGIAAVARCLPELADAAPDLLVARARAESIDLVVVGPEAPLAAGLADRLRDAGIATFGPSARAAQLEASKAFAKRFMARHGVPTAAFEVFDEAARAREHVRRLREGCVVKADGLAAGKGVAVCEGPAQAEAAIDEIMGARRFGAAGDRVVIEERLVGEEASFYAVSDGRNVVTLAPAQDFKRVHDGERGENTGGMGAYAPAARVDAALEKRVLEEIVHPTLRGMAAEGSPYRGVLYVGLMIDAEGVPRVVEFNVRFGDPETQPIALQMESDLLPLLDAAARGDLSRVAPPDGRGAAVCVVLCSGGYPRDYTIGRRIEGLDAAAALPGVVVFHAGTRRGADGGFVTAGGRVLGVTARGGDVAAARAQAYAAASKIHFEGMHYRRDIAARAATR